MRTSLLMWLVPAGLVLVWGCESTNQQGSTMRTEPQSTGLAGTPADADQDAQPAPAGETSESSTQGDTQDQAAKDEQAKQDQAKKDAEKLADLEQKFAIAKQKLKKARVGLENHEEDHKVTVARLKAEVDMAAKKLDDYVKVTAPAKIDRASLSLQMAEDRVKEQEEELTQLEATYNADELAKETKEIVLERSRRRLERAQRSLVLQRKELATLKNTTIPRQKETLQQALTNKKQELERHNRGVVSGRIDKRIALMNAENEVEKLEKQIEELREKVGATEDDEAAGDADADAAGGS